MKRSKLNAVVMASFLIITLASCSKTVEPNPTTTTQPVAVIQTPLVVKSQKVSYFVPKDITTYMNTEEAYASTGNGLDPGYPVIYIEKTTNTASPENPMQTAVQAALNLLPTGGGPLHGKVVYLKTIRTTAYIMLDIDFDGWAGVSLFRAAANPVITKNLLQFPAIKYVVFGPAPGDTVEKIGKTLNQ